MEKLILMIIVVSLGFFLGNRAAVSSTPEMKSSFTQLDDQESYCDMSAIKLHLKDLKTQEEIQMIVEKKKFCYYLIGEKKWGGEKEYYDFMKENENQVIEININGFKKYLGNLLGLKGKKLEEFIAKNYIVNQAITLEELGVADKRGLLEKYFDEAPEYKAACLKKEFYKEENSNHIVHSPSFTALLLSLNYEVHWDDWSAILCITGDLP